MNRHNGTTQAGQIANVFILVLGLGARRFLPAILHVPPRIMIPVIGVLCATGGFAINNSTFEVGLVAILGLSGYVLLRFRVPMAPVVLGLVLGPMIETNLRDALTASQMDASVFVTRPISAALLAAIVVTVAWSWRRKAKSR